MIPRGPGDAPYGHSLDGLAEYYQVWDIVSCSSGVWKARMKVLTCSHSSQGLREAGYHPPVFMSDNLDGGPEYNKRLQDQYAERIYMNDTFPGS